MRKSAVLVIAAIAVIVVPSFAYGAGDNAPAAVPAAASMDRAAIVSQVLSTWRGEISSRGLDVALWESDMRIALAKMSDGKLLSLAVTDSYDSVVKMMGGLVGPQKLSSGVDAKSSFSASPSSQPYILGDFSTDLVYVPITPCRAFDTRFAIAGKIANGATRSFYTNEVSAGATAWANQGGAASNCPQIPFDPVAVAITITATGQSGSGFLNMWPYLGTAPNTSFLNWAAANQTIANTTMTPTCYSCGPDINIAVASTTDVIGDIVGYYEQAIFPPAGRAYATVSKGTSPSFVTARTKNFSAVSQPSLGVYCLSTGVDVTNTPILVTVEWGQSLGNNLVAFVQTNSPAFGCTTGQVEVRTYDFTGALSNQVAFNVWIP